MRPITLKWAGGEHEFILPLEGLLALQELCDAGPEWILERLLTKRWLVEDVRETIRLGLEFGGKAPSEARRVFKLALENKGMLALVVTASAIIANAIKLGKDDKPGEPEAGSGNETRDPPSSEESGASQTTSGGPTSSAQTSAE